MKRFFGLLLVFGMMAGVAFAAVEDSVIFTVTPTGTQSIDISSATYALGSRNLNSTFTVMVGTMSNDGNLGSRWQKKGINASDGTNAWALTIGDFTNGADIYGLRSAVTVFGVLTEPTWAIADNVTTAYTNVTGATSVVAGVQKQLWVRVNMPTTSIGSAAYTFTLSYQAVAPQ